MPYIPPSQIVALIDQAFPWAAEKTGGKHVLTGHHGPSVGAIVALTDEMPPGVLSSLPPAEYATFYVARAALRTSLPMWESPSHPGLAHKLHPMAELGNRSPLQALRAVLALCPDEASASATSDLDFLGDPEFAHALQTDIGTATSALANAEFKASVVMAGSVIEAVLLWALRRRLPAEHNAAYAQWQAARSVAGEPAPPKLDKDILRWSLEQYVEIARYIPIIDSATADALRISRMFRNLIHPARAERLRQSPTLGSALLATGGMRLLVDDIRHRVAAGIL